MEGAELGLADAIRATFHASNALVDAMIANETSHPELAMWLMRMNACGQEALRVLQDDRPLTPDDAPN